MPDEDLLIPRSRFLLGGGKDEKEGGGRHGWRLISTAPILPPPLPRPVPNRYD